MAQPSGALSPGGGDVNPPGSSRVPLGRLLGGGEPDTGMPLPLGGSRVAAVEGGAAVRVIDLGRGQAGLGQGFSHSVRQG